MVYTDACNTGYGRNMVEHGCQVAQGQWTPVEAGWISPRRELRAVRLVLEFLLSKHENERFHWFTDNQNVARILLVGSKTAELREEAYAIFSISIVNRTQVEPEWIPHSRNKQADYVSRLVDHDDWQLDPDIFVELDRAWGPHSVDKFARFYNTQATFQL